MPAKKTSPKKRASRKVNKLLASSLFAKIYVILSLCAIVVTTFYWSLLSARVQSGNADQLVNADLFESTKTFHGATFSDVHTFLFKWPLFLLVRVFGSTTAVIEGATVGLALLTVLAFLVILYKIDSRPLVFGTVCLALASVLLLVPTVPYAGALLPVNMAMLATRNFEYILFIASIALFIRSPRLKSAGLWLSVTCLGLLIASDRFFLTLAVGGALIALIIYARSHAWNLANVAVNWLLTSVFAAIVALGLLALMSVSKITHLVGQSSASPYALVTSFKDIVLGVTYGLMGIFTNFGADPAFDATQVREIPHQLFARLLSISGPAYIVNFFILLAGLVAVFGLVRASLRGKKNIKGLALRRANLVSIVLTWATIAAFISFAISSHYYAVDARYLTIALFTVFISLVTYNRSRKWRSEALVSIGFILILGIVFGSFGATRDYRADLGALTSQNERNLKVAQALAQHHSDILVGDYWRVIPIKQAAGDKLNVMPLASCTEPRQVLSSSTWQPDLRTTGFAYLLSLNGSLTDYPNCTLPQIVGSYGKPNASALISGTLEQPKELLLFYDQGARRLASPADQPSDSSTAVLPIPLNQLTDTSCSSPSVTNIDAHEDDDLLFMNPDLLHEIKAGDCVHSIYLTAGDAGESEFYWLGREQGSEASYSYMLSSKAVWVERIVKLAPHEYVTIANPAGNTKVSLIFMLLPDGNLKGQGFAASDYESLAKLKDGEISTINSVDGQSSYTSAQLINALSTLLNTYQTTMVNTQAGFISQQYPDHSDHLTVNWYVKQAYQQYENQRYSDQVTIPINYYIGYPIHAMPPNISGADLIAKEQAFLAYAKFDSHVCQTLQACLQTPTYDSYLTREYTNPY